MLEDTQEVLFVELLVESLKVKMLMKIDPLIQLFQSEITAADLSEALQYGGPIVTTQFKSNVMRELSKELG